MRIYLYNRPFQCALQISHTKQAHLSLYFFYIKTKKCLSRLFNRQTNRQTNRRTRGSIGSRYVTLPIYHFRQRIWFKLYNFGLHWTSNLLGEQEAINHAFCAKSITILCHTLVLLVFRDADLRLSEMAQLSVNRLVMLGRNLVTFSK